MTLQQVSGFFSLFHTVVYSEGMESHRPLFAFAIFKHRITAAKRPNFALSASVQLPPKSMEIICYATQGVIGSIAHRENHHSTCEAIGHVTSIVPFFFQH